MSVALCFFIVCLFSVLIADSHCCSTRAMCWLQASIWQLSGQVSLNNAQSLVRNVLLLEPIKLTWEVKNHTNMEMNCCAPVVLKPFDLSTATVLYGHTHNTFKIYWYQLTQLCYWLKTERLKKCSLKLSIFRHSIVYTLPSWRSVVLVLHYQNNFKNQGPAARPDKGSTYYIFHDNHILKAFPQNLIRLRQSTGVTLPQSVVQTNNRFLK